MKFVVSIILGALLAATALTEPAQAFFIVPAIIGFIGITGIAATLATVAVEIGLAVGLSYLAKALAPKPKQEDLTQLPGGTSGKLQFGGAVPRSFIVGVYATAGSLVYANTYSADAAGNAATALGGPVTAASGNTPNAYLTQVISLSDLPVTGLANVFVNGVLVSYDPDAAQSFEGIAIPQYNRAGADYLWLRFYDGTQVAADPALVALFGTDSGRPYGADRVGHGVAYAVVTARVNQELFTGFPQLKFVLNGTKLYDRRFDDSAGGIGTQRWSDPTTWQHTQNPGVIAENILRGISYGGTWLYGAQTVSNAQLPAASWMAAQSECDVLIDLAAGGNEPQFLAGGEINVGHEPADTLDELLKSCNGRLAEIGGTYKLRVGAAGVAVFSFTDADILSTEQQTFDPFPGLQKTINAVTAKYVSPGEGWITKDAPPLYDATLETADGGRRQAVDVQYSFVFSGTQVQRLMKAERDTQRAFRRHALPLPPEGFVLEPLDVVSWTSARNGYIAKTFDIQAMDDLPNLNVGISIQELDPNAYDWTPLTDQKPTVDGPILILRPQPQPIVDWSAEPWTIHSDGDQDRAAIKLNWDPNTDDVKGIAFQVRLTKDQSIVYASSYDDRVKAGSIIISQNILGATAYQVRGEYVPITQRETTWSGWLDVLTPDVRVKLETLDQSIKDAITKQFSDILARADKTAALIASVAAEQDAANWIDKVKQKGIVQETKVELQNKLDTANASIQTVSDAVVSVDGALTTLSTSVTAQFGSITATVNQNTTALASANAAFTSFQTSTQTTLNSLSSSTSSLQTSFATLNGSFGSFQTSVNASIGSLNASVSTNTTAVATIGGKLAAQWLVTLDVNGYVSGIKSYNSGSTSQFIIIVDDFLIAKPGVAGGAPMPVFAISSVGGVTKVALRGDMLADGLIKSRSMETGTITAESAILANASVGTLTVAGNAITQSWQAIGGSVSPSGATPLKLIDMTVTTSANGTGLVDVDASVNCNLGSATGSGQGGGTVFLAVDGVTTGISRPIPWYVDAVTGGAGNIVALNSINLAFQFNFGPGRTSVIGVYVYNFNSNAVGTVDGAILRAKESKR